MLSGVRHCPCMQPHCMYDVLLCCRHSVRLDVYEPFWAAKRAEARQRAGLPANSTTCPAQPTRRSIGRTTTGLAVGVAMGGACLVAAISTAAIALSRRAHKGHKHPCKEGGLCGLLPATNNATAPEPAAAGGTQTRAVVTPCSIYTPESTGRQARYSGSNSSTSGFNSSPFALFLFGRQEASVLPAPVVAAQPAASTATTSTQQYSSSGIQPPTGSCSTPTSGSNQAAESSSADRLGPLPPSQHQWQE